MELCSHTWGTNANGVTQGDFVAAHLVQLSGNMSNFRCGHWPFDRTCYSARHIPSDGNIAFLGCLANQTVPGQALFKTAVDVRLAERLRGCCEKGHLFRSRFHRCLETLHVGRQHWESAPALAVSDVSHDIFRICKLPRQPCSQRRCLRSMYTLTQFVLRLGKLYISCEPCVTNMAYLRNPFRGDKARRFHNR